jgi:hypothetical protein
LSLERNRVRAGDLRLGNEAVRHPRFSTTLPESARTCDFLGVLRLPLRAQLHESSRDARSSAVEGSVQWALNAMACSAIQASEQYIAVTAGWGLDAQGVQNGIDKIRGTTTVVPKAGTVLVFKLRKA